MPCTHPTRRPLLLQWRAHVAHWLRSRVGKGCGQEPESAVNCLLILRTLRSRLCRRAQMLELEMHGSLVLLWLLIRCPYLRRLCNLQDLQGHPLSDGLQTHCSALQARLCATSPAEIDPMTLTRTAVRRRDLELPSAMVGTIMVNSISRTHICHSYCPTEPIGVSQAGT
jgi:hypothetical protein